MEESSESVLFEISSLLFMLTMGKEKGSWLVFSLYIYREEN